MGKTDNNQNNTDQVDADNAAAIAAEQAQLTFFDTVTAPTMTTENTLSAEAERDQTPAEAAQTESADPAHAVEEQESPDAVEMTESLGQRLRAAREARGMRCEEAAQKMKLPMSTVQAIEADRYDRIGEGIYLRSYLSKYLRLLDLPQVLAERVLNQPAELPPLVTSGTISRPRYLFERYSSSALYLILTAVIIVPAVWLAMRAGFDTNFAQITPLDTPDATTPAQTGSSAGNASGNTTTQLDNAAQQAAGAHPADEPPLVASLAPFPAIKHDGAEAEPAERAESAPIAGVHSLRITLAESSWVEIVAADGEKIEYGLLPAGTVRSYHSQKSIDVRVGNVNGATIEVDGKSQDLVQFRHSNVAHFRLASGESTISHSGG